MNTQIPSDFVYVKEIIPSILHHLRYAEAENFVGRPVDGYDAAKGPLLTLAAANALKKVAEDVHRDGYLLAIYDTYRAQRSVLDLQEWGASSNDNDPHEERIRRCYYPTYTRKELFEGGYIASRSSHSRGSTVDLSLVLQSEKARFESGNIRETPLLLGDGRQVTMLDDGTFHVAGHFDLFDVSSHHDCGDLLDAHPEAVSNRRYLREAMDRHGFSTIPTEWWHFTLRDEPYPDTYFDFPQ